MKSAYVIIAHGSRDKQANEDFFSFIEVLRTRMPKRFIEPAFLELGRPSIEESLDACAKTGAGQIFILPFMLFSGRHVKEDIPRFIQQAKAKYPAVDFHYSAPLAEGEELIGVMERKMKSLKGSHERI